MGAEGLLVDVNACGAAPGAQTLRERLERGILLHARPPELSEASGAGHGQRKGLARRAVDHAAQRQYVVALADEGERQVQILRRGEIAARPGAAQLLLRAQERIEDLL